MTTTTESQDEQLRALVTSADPMAGEASTPEHLWARIAEDIDTQTSAVRDDHPEAAVAPQGSGQRRGFARRHWQAGLLVAAGVATLALAAGTVLPGYLGISGDDTGTTSAGGVATDQGEAPAVEGPGFVAPDETALPGRDAAQGVTDSDSSATTPAASKDPTLVRSGSVLVGTDDVQGGRNTFVTAIQGMGGMIVSETVSTQGADGSMPMGRAADDMMMTYPYPYPSGPGIWLTVKVPATSYDQAMAAARSTGDVVQLQQTSYDVGTQITDVRARIAVLTASLKRLQGLMDEVSGVSDMIQLEQAIAARQSELDSLLAQQRDLADQTEMSQISLTLMSPEDAQRMVDPNPQLTWWESFVKGLGQFWSWLGQALLIVSPLLIAGAILLWVRRRRRSGPAAPTEGPTPETA